MALQGEMDVSGSGCPGLWQYHFAVLFFSVSAVVAVTTSRLVFQGLEVAECGQREQS